MPDYALEGVKWGTPQFGGPGGTVTWALDGSVPAYFASEIAAAFSRWSSYGDISFSQVASVASSAIDITLGPIDGPNAVLGRAAYAYSGTTISSATITFDSAEGWHPSGQDVVTSSGADLFVVALHEIGHAIGLDHYDGSLAIMNTVLSPGLDDLTSSDIQGVQAIYGASFAAAADLVMHNGSKIQVGTAAGGALSFADVGGFGPEWDLIGFGQFDAGLESDFLIRSAGTGEIRLGRAAGGAGTEAVGGVGPEWSFLGSADYTGDGRADLLMRNAAGTLELASISGSGALQYQAIGGIGLEWTFGQLGANGERTNPNGVSGDFLGQGRNGFVMYSSGSHDLSVVEVVNGQAAYTVIGQVGPEWQLLASGDFVGDPRDDFLIYNTGNHQIQAVTIVGGRASFTTVGAVGPEWQFVGSGDYDRDGRDGALMHRVAADGNGWLQEVEVVGGQATYTTIGGVGPEWDLIA